MMNSNIPLGNESTAYDMNESAGMGISRRLDSLFGYDQAFNASEAAKQRNWETQMSNTAYQRGVSDMEAAGLNPYLLYGKGGQPASTPSGSAARSSGGQGVLPSLIGAMVSVHNNAMNVANTATIARNQLAAKQAFTTAYEARNELYRVMNRYNHFGRR